MNQQLSTDEPSAAPAIEAQPALHANWNWIHEHRDDIAAELLRFGSEIGGRDQMMLKRIARWFKRSCQIEKALTKPSILAICNPLIAADQNEAEASIARAVRIGFANITRVNSTRGGLTRILMPPMLLLLAITAMVIFFSLTMIPHFDAILADFETTLPKLTEVILKLGKLIQKTWAFVCPVVAGIVVLFILYDRIRGQKWMNQTTLDRLLASPRATAGNWAWHMSLLLESGLDNPSAVKLAGDSQRKNWMKRACRQWIEHSDQDYPLETRAANESTPAPNPEADDPATPLFGKRLKLLETTLQIENHDARVDLFREVANFYWSQSRGVLQWWASWIMSLLFWLTMAFAIIVIYALYAPLVAFLTGLTGF